MSALSLVHYLVHYLALLERKIGALDQAAPLAEWDLPAEFQTLRRLMEARLLKAGRRAYVQVLRLPESFELEELHLAVKTALRLGAISFDAVKHLVLCQVERRPPRLGRRLADVADLHDRLTFHGIQLHTPSQGEITPMHTAVMGMVAQQDLADLRDKTRRGQRGRARSGRTPGGLGFGYRVVAADTDGAGRRGET